MKKCCVLFVGTVVVVGNQNQLWNPTDQAKKNKKQTSKKAQNKHKKAQNKQT